MGPVPPESNKWDIMELNPIACEICRTKKRKCDRNVPICSPCSAAGTTCQYPQSNKRGIPSGYISNLEQRLLETETALFEALSLINVPFHQDESPHAETHYHDAFIEHGTAQSKEEKLEEWKHFPLRLGEQRQAWLEEKLRIANRRDGRRNSDWEHVATQRTEQQWIGSSLPQPIQQNAPKSTLQEHSIIHPHNANDVQTRPPDEYQRITNADRNTQFGQGHLQTRFEGPERSANSDRWTSNSALQPDNDGSRCAAGEVHATYDLDGLVEDSQLLEYQHMPVLQTAREEDQMEAVVSPSVSLDRNGSISSGLTTNPREAQRFSSKQWHKYF